MGAKLKISGGKCRGNGEKVGGMRNVKLRIVFVADGLMIKD
jgi:hypothetical protein